AHRLIDEHTAALDHFGGNALAPRNIARQDAPAETERRVVGGRDGCFLVLHRDNGGDGTEQLLFIRGHTWAHVAEHGRWIERTAARSRSASWRPRWRSLPPSARTVFVSIAPAMRATARPAGALPVSVTAFTDGCSITPSTCWLPIIKVRKRFSGKPAWQKIFSIASAQPGTFEACLSTAPLPAMSAGAAKRKTCQNGKFHGITASTTPSGSKRTRLRFAFVGITRSSR